jgi:2-hydroxy-3-keto-5-methylthiopentenyl-1-phosphate phosphatase
MLELARSQPLRSGLRDLIEFLDGQGVEFVVVSGGIRGMVEAALGDLADRVVGIHAMDVDTTGEYLAVRSEFEGEVELVDKLKVVSRYLGTPLPAGGFTNENWIAIGDSVTDLNMALAAPTVFARSRLKTYLDDRGKVYTPYESFFEVRDRLAQLWNVPIFAGLYSSIK